MTRPAARLLGCGGCPGLQLTVPDPRSAALPDGQRHFARSGGNPPRQHLMIIMGGVNVHTEPEDQSSAATGNLGARAARSAARGMNRRRQDQAATPGVGSAAVIAPPRPQVILASPGPSPG